jgi:NADH-quinone oxidoreductase subunit J
MIADAVGTLLFYAFAFAAFLLATAVVCERKLLRAAVALMGVLGVSAAFYALLGAHFLAGVQVMVYVGGVVVLIIFAIMLTQSGALLEDIPSLWRRLLGGAASVGFFVLTLFALIHSPLTQCCKAAPEMVKDDTRAIGRALLDTGGEGYVLPFEIISLVLLAALIGGIVIARKLPPTDQPFTTGGDLPGEADGMRPKNQDN